MDWDVVIDNNNRVYYLRANCYDPNAAVPHLDSNGNPYHYYAPLNIYRGNEVNWPQAATPFPSGYTFSGNSNCPLPMGIDFLPSGTVFYDCGIPSTIGSYVITISDGKGNTSKVTIDGSGNITVQ